MAELLAPPIFNTTLGLSPVALTVTASLKVAVICTTSPAFKMLLTMPLAPVMFMLVRVGTPVSMDTLALLPTWPGLPAKSV